MLDDIERARARRDKAVANFGNRNRNGATSASLAWRRIDEQEYRLACDELRRLGDLNPLRRKYRRV